MYSIAVTNHHIVCGTYENLIHVRAAGFDACGGLGLGERGEETGGWSDMAHPEHGCAAPALEVSTSVICEPCCPPAGLGHRDKGTSPHADRPRGHGLRPRCHLYAGSNQSLQCVV